MYEDIKKSILSSPVIDKNGYLYIVHPITDGVPRMEPNILREVIDWAKENGDFDCDVLLTPEAMGIPIAVPLSLELNIPYLIVRKKKYDLPGEICIHQKTGYSKSEMYINGLHKGDRVTIIDDVLSTGGTLRVMVDALEKNGIKVVNAIIVFNKGEHRESLKKELGIDIVTMIDIGVRDGKPIYLD